MAKMTKKQIEYANSMQKTSNKMTKKQMDELNKQYENRQLTNTEKYLEDNVYPLIRKYGYSDNFRDKLLEKLDALPQKKPEIELKSGFQGEAFKTPVLLPDDKIPEEFTMLKDYYYDSLLKDYDSYDDKNKNYRYYLDKANTFANSAEKLGIKDDTNFAGYLYQNKDGFKKWYDNELENAKYRAEFQAKQKDYYKNVTAPLKEAEKLKSQAEEARKGELNPIEYGYNVLAGFGSGGGKAREKVAQSEEATQERKTLLKKAENLAQSAEDYKLNEYVEDKYKEVSSKSNFDENNISKKYEGKSSFKLNKPGDLEYELTFYGFSGDVNAEGFTKKQAETYLYILNTEGKKAANEYAEKIKPLTEKGKAQYTYNITNGVPVLEQLTGSTVNYISGFDEAVVGMLNVPSSFVGKTIEPNPNNIKMTAEIFNENANTGEKALYGVSSGLGQMTPTLIAGSAGAGAKLSNLVFASSVYGNSYKEAKNSGAGTATSIGYGMANAGLELVLENMGGFVPGGGKAKVSFGRKLASSLDDVFKASPKVRAAFSIGGKVASDFASEFTEEYLSATFGPVLRNVFLSENNDFTLVSEQQLEDGLIGGFTGLILGSPSYAKNIASTFKKGNYGAEKAFYLGASDSFIESEMVKSNPGAFNGLSEKQKSKAIVDYRLQKVEEAGYSSIYGNLITGVANGKSLDDIKADIADEGVNVNDYFNDEQLDRAYTIAKQSIEAVRKSVNADVLNAQPMSQETILDTVRKLINDGKSNAEIIDTITTLDNTKAPNDVRELVRSIKDTAFINSIPSGMTNAQKAQAIKDYVAKENELDLQYINSQAETSEAISTEHPSVDSASPSEKNVKADIGFAISSVCQAVIGSFKSEVNADISYDSIEKPITEAIGGEVFNEAAFISSLAKVYSDALKRKNANAYIEVSQSGIDIPDALTTYHENGTIPENVNAKAFIALGIAFTNITESAVAQIKAARTALASDVADSASENAQKAQAIKDYVARSAVSNATAPITSNVQEAEVEQADVTPVTVSKTEKVPVENQENVVQQSDVEDENFNIENLGASGKSVYNSIMSDVVNRVGTTSESNKQFVEEFKYIYNTAASGKNVDASKVSKFTEDEVNRIVNAAKNDTKKVKVVKKEDARLIKNDAFYKANVSKREERMLKAFAKLCGRDIIFSDTLKGNAQINLSTGVIEISVNAKNGTKWALIHEAFHALKADSPAEANSLQKAVIDIISKNAKSFIKTQAFFMDVYGNEIFDKDGKLKEGAEDYIKEEMVADMLGYVLSKSDVLSTITGEQRNILQKFIDKLTERFSEDYLEKAVSEDIRQAYKDLYKEVDTIAKQFKEVFDKASKETKNTVSEDGGTVDAKDGIRHSYSSIANTFFGDENMASVDFIKKNYKDTEGYKNYVEKCLDNMRQSRENFDENTAREEIEKQIDGIVRVALASKKAGYDIADNKNKRDVKDSKSRLLFSSLEPNSDYFTSSDISTICDKRKNFAEIYDEIVRIEEEKGVPEDKRFFSNVDNYFVIHKIMADMGLTQPCRQCYVESMRKNLAPMANAFLKLVNETDAGNKSNDQLYSQSGKTKGELKSNNAKLRENVLKTFDDHPEYDMTVSDLTVETLTTEEGLALLKIKAPLIYEAFNSFYGQSKPKMPKAATPFRFGELTALLTDNNGKINQRLVYKINSTGGFRLQSYSDFQIQNYVDVLQVLFEAGTLGLNGHAYTKVPAFLEATDNTNLKRNISIFMYKDGNEWKLDKNDSFPYDLEEIYEIVKADKSGNTGIIAVSQNKDMSCWIMANDMIGYGIPFHKSGLKMGVVRDTDVKTEDGRVIKGYAGTIDHTKQQTEVWAKTTDGHKALTKVSNGINIYSFWDFDNKSNLSKKELIENNLKLYIDECEKAGYLPKFRDYVMNNGAVLSSVLSYAKELGYASKDATVEDISFNYKGYTIPYGYYKFLGDFSMFTPDGKASAQKVLSLENYDFDKAVDFFSDAESLRRNEILQQFANGEERAKYRDSKLSAEELEKIVDKKRKDIAKEVTETRKSKDLSGKENDFSLDKSAEETRDLVAFHNINEQKLLDALNRGALLMPSIAVSNIGMTDFGDISMVFEKDTINPETNASNKLYGSDAWTPTQVSMKMNPKFDNKKVSAVINVIKKTLGDNQAQLFDFNVDTFEKAIEQADGSVYHAFAENLGIQAAYSLNKGYIQKIPTNKDGIVDTEALRDDIEANLNKDEVWRAYKIWLENISNTVITSYDKATNEEILRNMKAQPDSAKKFKLSEQGDLTVPSVPYASIQKLKNNKSRLSSEADSMAKDVGADFIAWANGVSQSTGEPTSKIIKAINESFGSRYDATAIAESFIDKGITIMDTDALSLQALYKSAVELPTRYFEAKPGRAIGFEEVAMIILPSNASKQLRAELDNNNIPYTEYEAGNNDARLEALDSVQDVKFSKDLSGMDADYMKAVNSGDMATAQTMVDEAAKKLLSDSKVRDRKGKLLVMYHGTKVNFTIFEKSALSDGFGFFFTEDKSEAAEYGTPKACYLNITNPFDMYGDTPIEDFFGDAPKYVDGHFNWDAAKSGLINAGYDGVYSYSHGTTWYIAFNSEQIKSADPVTYDDNGNIIPLSERFNPEKSDIRWSKDLTNVDFAKDKYFDRKIDKWNELKENYISAGTVKRNSVLNRVGVPIGKIYYDVSKIKKGMEDHKDHLNTDILKRVPEVLNHPIVITEYKPGKNTNTISVFGDLIVNNKPVVVGLIITTGSGNNVISKIRSVHMQSDLRTQITNESILYLSENKKETNAWFNSYAGIDVPEVGTQLGIIRSIDFNNNILQKQDIVNSFSKDNIKLSKDLSGESELFDDDRTMTEEQIKQEIYNQYLQVQALERWGINLDRVDNASKMSIDEAVKKVSKSFDINITHGSDASVSKKTALGAYNIDSKTIRTKFQNDLPSIVHALGYHVDNNLHIVDDIVEQTARVRENNSDGIGEFERELLTIANPLIKESRAKILDGFAEFMRLYLVSKPMAEERAPAFYSYFESKLKSDETIAKAIEESANTISNYFAQGIEGRASAAVMTAKDWEKLNKPKGKEAIKQFWHKWVAQKLMDRFYALKAVEKEYNVFDLSTSNNAYVKATLSLNSRARASRLLEDGFYDANGNKVGESFFDIISPLGGVKSYKFEDFGKYLAYVHALEWLSPVPTEGKKTPSGKAIRQSKAKKVFGDDALNDVNALNNLINNMEKKYPEFKGIAEKIYEYQDNLMEYYLIPGGAINRDQAETFRVQYPHYVPFNRFNSASGMAIESSRKGTNLFANLKNLIKKADGGTTSIRNPLESIINSTVAAVDFYMKNDTMKQLITEFTGNGTMPGVMERIYSDKELKKLKEEDKNPFIIEETFDEQQEVNNSTEPVFNPTVNKEKGIVFAWVNGEKQYYQIYNRELYNAVANLDVQDLNKFFKVANTISNSMKKLITQLNPLFSAGNFYRDFQTFHYQSTANPDILTQLAMYGGAIKSIITKDEDFKTYRALGGMDSTKFRADMDIIEKVVSKNNNLENKFIKALKTLKFVAWDAFWELNDVAETLPRLAEFKYTVKESGGDVQLAMYRANDVTTNFSRSGTWGRQVNSIFLYSNATLQGLDKMVRNFTEAGYTSKDKSVKAFKAEVAGRVIKYVGWSIFLTALQEFLNRRDEEAEEEYRRLSDFMKNNYDVFYLGNGRFAKLPKEQNNAVFRSVIQRVIDAFAEDGIDMKELGSYIWTGLMPNFIPDIFDVENALSQIGNNTFLGPLTDVATNRDFKGSEIVPSYLDGADFEKYTSSTSSMSINFAKKLYQATGMDISPMSIDHVLKNAGGYYGGLFVKLFPNIDVDQYGAIGSASKNILDAAGLKTKFVTDARYSTDLLNDFYDGKDKADNNVTINGTGSNRVKNERYQSMSEFITNYQKVSRTGSEEQQRNDRKMLQVLLDGFGKDKLSPGEQYAVSLYDSTGIADVFKNTFPSYEFKGKSSTKKGVKTQGYVVLDANQYAEFCAEISDMREKVRVMVQGFGLDDMEAASLLVDLYKDIDTDMKEKYIEKYGSYIQTTVEKSNPSYDEKKVSAEYGALFNDDGSFKKK